MVLVQVTQGAGGYGVVMLYKGARKEIRRGLIRKLTNNPNGNFSRNKGFIGGL